MKNKIMIVGEAWGKDEAAQRRPFVGGTGKLLRGLLRQVGIDPAETYMTNVFNLQPQPRNDIRNLCGTKPEGIKGMPFLQRSKYVLAKYEPELHRLYQEVKDVQPNLILACGATPCWALLGTEGIKKLRGAPILSNVGSTKLLPTYHPSAVARDWKLRPIVLSDLAKAKAESEFPEIRRPKREIWIEPNTDDIARFIRKYIIPSPDLSIDIETVGGKYITCIGFAPTVDRALVIPFHDSRKKGCNYWQTLSEETAAWDLVRYICGLDKNIVGQNFIYDMQRLWDVYGIPCPHASNDTMLRHHAMQPEMEKGLDFLASIYTDELKWKFMGKGGGLIKEIK